MHSSVTYDFVEFTAPAHVLSVSANHESVAFLPTHVATVYFLHLSSSYVCTLVTVVHLSSVKTVIWERWKGRRLAGELSLRSCEVRVVPRLWAHVHHRRRGRGRCCAQRRRVSGRREEAAAERRHGEAGERRHCGEGLLRGISAAEAAVAKGESG